MYENTRLNPDCSAEGVEREAEWRAHVRKAFPHGAMAGENRLPTLELRSAHQQLTAIDRQFEEVLAWQGTGY